MELAQLKVEQVRGVTCPHCSMETLTIEHLLRAAWKEIRKEDTDDFSTTFGPWFCSSCNRSYVGRIIWDFIEEKFIVYVDKRSAIRTKTLTLLRCEDVLLLCEGIHIEDPSKEGLMRGTELLSDEHKEMDRFYYEENTSTVNFFRKVIAVFSLDEAGNPMNDPHTLFDYVDTQVDDRVEWEKEGGSGDLQDYLTHKFSASIAEFMHEKTGIGGAWQ